MESNVAAHVADRDGPERVIVGYPVWVVGWAPLFKHVTEFVFDVHDQGESVLTVECPHEQQWWVDMGGAPST